LIAHAPTAITSRGAGVASHVSKSARRMLVLTAPVTTSPSACRRDELDSEARHIEHDVAEGHQLGLAAVAASRGDRAQTERASEEAPHPCLERRRQLHLPIPAHKARTGACRHAMILREGERPVLAGGRLVRGEERGTHVHLDAGRSTGQQGGRYARRAAGTAAVALGGVELGSSAESGGEIGAAGREG
jgi:hypothetical protein